jgi:hypothetical protein
VREVVTLRAASRYYMFCEHARMPGSEEVRMRGWKGRRRFCSRVGLRRQGLLSISCCLDSLGFSGFAAGPLKEQRWQGLKGSAAYQGLRLPQTDESAASRGDGAHRCALLPLARSPHGPTQHQPVSSRKRALQKHILHLTTCPPTALRPNSLSHLVT